MQWIGPPEKDTATDTLDKRLWDAADQFRANFGLKPQEYSDPTLGLIFPRFAEVHFVAQLTKLEKTRSSEQGLRRQFIEHRTWATGAEATRARSCRLFRQS